MCSPIFRILNYRSSKNGSRIYDSGDYPLLKPGKGFGPVNHLAPLFLRRGESGREEILVKESGIGTSGWSYPHWEEVFLSSSFASKSMAPTILSFDTVEVNSSFIISLVPLLSKWRDTSSGFIFPLKPAATLPI